MGKGGGGSSGGGGGTTTTVSQPPQAVLDQYNKVVGQANTVAGTPLQQYQGNMVAGFTPDQSSAFNTVNGLQGSAQPYINQAAGLINQSTTPLNVTPFSASAVSQYQNPYTQQVVDSTMAQMQNMDAQQQQQLKGNAVSSGAFGGDRAGVASAALSGQQDLANNSTIAGLYGQGYNQALGEFNTQQQTQLSADQANKYLQAQGAYGLGNLGNETMSTGLQGANAQLTTGGLQQALAQSQLNVPYQQFLQQQAYPFQTSQWLANISEGIGSNSGGTSSTTAPAPSTTSQALGAGMFGIGALGSMFNRGGSVRGYRGGGGVRGYASGGSPENDDFNIPDVSLSYIPLTNLSMGAGPPRPPNAQDIKAASGQDSTQSGASFGKGLGSIGKGLFGGSSSGSGSGNSPGFDGLMQNLTGSASGDQGAANYIGSSGSDQVASDVASEDAAGSGSSWFGDLFSSAGDSFGRGGNTSSGRSLGARHLASGGGSDPLTALGMGSGSGNGPSQSKVDHDNKWMSQVGDIIGTVVGSVFGGPAGGYVGGKAGADGGGTLGDLFGGNWDSLGSDLRAGPAGAIYPNDSSSGEGNSPQLGGNFSGTTFLSAYGNGDAGLGSTGGGAGNGAIGAGLNQFASFLKNGGGIRGYDDGGFVDNDTPSSTTATPSDDSSGGQRLSDGNAKPNVWNALMSAGAATMAGQSPNAWSNIGQGAMAGVKNYGDQKKESSDENYKQGELDVRRQEAKARAQQLATEAERWKSTLAQNQEKIDQGHFTMSPTGFMYDTKTGQPVAPGAGNGGSGNPNALQPLVSGFPVPSYINDPITRKSLAQADETDLKSQDVNRYYAQAMLDSLDKMDMINKAYPDLSGAGGTMAAYGRMAGQRIGVGDKDKADAMNEMMKNSNDLATNWNNFQHVPGGRGSVMALKTILASKPGVDQTGQTNANIIAELKGRVSGAMTNMELADAYRGAEGTAHIADGNVDKLDAALQKIYPFTTVDPATRQTIFHPENVESYRSSIEDSIRNPTKYFDLASARSGGGKSAPPAVQTRSSGSPSGALVPPPTPAHAGSGQNPAISQQAIQYLNSHPETASQFEQKFGVSARDYLQ